MRTVEAPFEHVLRMSDDVGIFEHASGSTPERHHGYCVDDVARALVVVEREPRPTQALLEVADRYLDFVVSAQGPDGRCRNRLGLDRRWHDEPGVEDCWGRALWALGTAAARGRDEVQRDRAAARFALGASRRSPHLRSMVFAALGAAEVLAAAPGDKVARALLAAAVRAVGRPVRDAAWPWPEPRLAYANAALAEVLVAAGELLGDVRALDDGLHLLGWLLEVQTRDGHLSVVPVGGWARGEERRCFDQQPIEVAALADACARAWRVAGDDRFSRGVDLAVGWFLGENDTTCALLDPSTGGGFDGLTPDGCNANQGAESTLAMVATLQHASDLVRR
ncbi:MAG: glycosyltransferase [Acidimicrobiales bacterium]